MAEKGIMDSIDGFIRQAKQAGNKRVETWLNAVKEAGQKALADAEERARNTAQTVIDQAEQEARKIVENATAKADKRDSAAVLPRTDKRKTGNDSYPLVAGAPDTLVIHCGDPRFQAAFFQFIQREVSPGRGYVLIVFPGSAQMLTFGDHIPKFTSSLMRPLEFFLKEGHLKRVVIIAHEDCKWYERFVPKFILAQMSVREQQTKDMEKAGKTLQALFSGVKVELYYANIAKGGAGVEFERISEKAAVR